MWGWVGGAKKADGLPAAPPPRANHIFLLLHGRFREHLCESYSLLPSMGLSFVRPSVQGALLLKE